MGYAAQVLWKFFIHEKRLVDEAILGHIFDMAVEGDETIFAASFRGYLPSSPLTRMLLVDLSTPRIRLQKLR